MKQETFVIPGIGEFEIRDAAELVQRVAPLALPCKSLYKTFHFGDGISDDERARVKGAYLELQDYILSQLLLFIGESPYEIPHECDR